MIVSDAITTGEHQVTESYTTKQRLIMGQMRYEPTTNLVSPGSKTIMGFYNRNGGMDSPSQVSSNAKNFLSGEKLGEHHLKQQSIDVSPSKLESFNLIPHKFHATQHSDGFFPKNFR